MLHYTKSAVRHVAYRHLHYRALKHFAQALDDGESVIPRPERPIIVIGMHRSGTTLLVRQLEDLGVAMGKWQGKNTSEALFFRHRNQLLLSLTHAGWDTPESFLRALDNPNWRRAFARVAACDLGTIRTLNFLPPKMLARNTRVPNRFWGFKDPRTSLTLPVWLDIFPDARIINIVRDGNAVASSLCQRSKEWLQDGLPLSLVTLDPAIGLSLWAEYVLTAQKHCRSLPQDQYHEIRYENLLRAPDVELLRVAEFVGMDVNLEKIGIASSRVNRSPRLVKYSSKVSPEAQRALELYDYL